MIASNTFRISRNLPSDKQRQKENRITKKSERTKANSGGRRTHVGSSHFVGLAGPVGLASCVGWHVRQLKGWGTRLIIPAAEPSKRLPGTAVESYDKLQASGYRRATS